MKHRFCAIVLVGAFLMLAAGPVLAHDYDSDDSDHWLRYAAYVVHPVGMALEFGITRPIHWLVSRPNLCAVFGHKPGPNDEYFKWKTCGSAAKGDGCCPGCEKAGASAKAKDCEPQTKIEGDTAAADAPEAETEKTPELVLSENADAAK